MANNIGHTRFPSRPALSIFYAWNLIEAEAEISDDITMEETEEKSPDELSLLRRGVDPFVVEGLKLSQRVYRQNGKDFDLEEVYALEVDPEAQAGSEDVEYANG